MKKFNLLLLALALQSSYTFAQEQSGLIFWSDYNYFKDNTRPMSQNDNSYFKLSTQVITLPPIAPPKTPVLPPTPSSPKDDSSTDIDNPTTSSGSATASPKNGYIFYNKLYYPGKNLYTDKLPLKGDLTITTNNAVGMGSILSGYTLFNKNTLTVDNNPGNTTTTGMQASGGGTVINDGNININGLYGNGINIISDGTGINNGKINLNSYYATGIEVYGKTKGVNNGTISGHGYEGAQIFGEGEFTNSPTGIIDITHGNVGVSVNGKGLAINDGVIKTYNTNFGMFASYGTIINNGTITMNDTAKNPNNVASSGMGVSEGGLAINNGTINITGRSYSGMSGGKNTILKNFGLININPPTPKDIYVDGSYAFQLSSSAVATNEPNGVINLNKNGILLNGKGTLHNWGKIIKPTINTLPLIYEGGNLVMEKGGSIVTNTSTPTIRTMYLGKSYIGNNYNLISKVTLDDTLTKSTKEIKSSLYGYKLVLHGNEAIFSKLSFSLLTDDPLGDYLENIYYDSKNSAKDRLFDIILSSKNSNNFENYLDEIFGRGYFPSLMYQTKDAIEFGNNNILSHLTEIPKILSKERYIFGYSFEKVNKSGYDNILGYNQELNSLFIGKNYPLTSSISSGWILNYTRLSDKFKNNYGKREDNLFQGTGYLNYNKNNFNSLGAIFLGYSRGDLDRNIQFDYSHYNETFTSIKTTNFNETLDSKIKNFYVGGMGKISKIFNWNSFYIEPVGKIQSMGIFQKSINENNGTYNLNLDKLNGFLNTFYLGGDLGKEFCIKNYGVKLSLVGYLKQDLNDIDKNMKFKVQSLGNETGNINIDNKNRFSQEIGINVKVGELQTGLSIYTNYSYEFSKDDSWKIGAGISYIL
ncbi:autotransporter domain-containing protein [uncultured Cetobacterium sp.]|uniref:autotransporter outer membrane beta-barrel domain-containing protein n=1 Tax=uncultured Cetobacterium sp. TaxID=527638 RepID=UPI0026156DEB|nr:autotransporter domain-containing protein [uncultured Cetobacterium sp.]